MALHTEGTKRKPFITKNMSTPKYPDSNNPKWNSTTAMIAMPAEFNLQMQQNSD